jgi:hypothetical protein
LAPCFQPRKKDELLTLSADKKIKEEDYQAHSIETETSRDPEPSVGNKRGRDDSEAQDIVCEFSVRFLRAKG